MSAEFLTNDNENTALSAIENMDRTVEYLGDVPGYVQSIQETYAQYPEGPHELSTMMNAAKLISYRGNNIVDEKIRSVYHGELLGLELINNIEPGVNTYFKKGFAHSFLRHRAEIRAATHRGENPMEDSVIMQSELSSPDYLSDIDPRYERFGQKLTSDLTDDLLSREYAMMGFRMILAQALSPKFLGISSSAYIPPIGEIEQIVGETAPLKWEDISDKCREILNAFNYLEMSEEERDNPTLQTESALETFMEARLVQFNEECGIIGKGDLLSVIGDQFVLEHVGETTPVAVPMAETTELRGIVEGIHLINAPTQRRLTQFKEDGNINNDSSTLVPAIRILNPIGVSDYDEFQTRYQYNLGSIMDIPIYYNDVKFSQLKAEAIEN
jgi:hypothetical protein